MKSERLKIQDLKELPMLVRYSKGKGPSSLWVILECGPNPEWGSGTWVRSFRYDDPEMVVGRGRWFSGQFVKVSEDEEKDFRENFSPLGDSETPVSEFIISEIDAFMLSANFEGRYEEIDLVHALEYLAGSARFSMENPLDPDDPIYFHDTHQGIDMIHDQSDEICEKRGLPKGG